MADITVSFTDGTSHVYENAPDSLTRDDVLKRVMSDFPDKRAENLSRESYKEMGALDVATKAVKNLPSSTSKMVGDIISAISSPLQTGKAILDVGAGALQNILPEALVQAIGEDKQSRQAASQVAQMYVDKYGSVEGAKKAIATDPASVMADISTVLTGGGAAATKLAQMAPKARLAGGLGQVGQALSTAGSTVDPLSLAARGAVAGARGAGKVAENVLGMTTGVGSEPISQAFKAGLEGGQRGQQFTQNMRGTADMMEVLDIAKQNLNQIRVDRSNTYKANMANIKGDKTVLDFSGIDKAVDEAFNKVSFKGQITNKDAAAKVVEAQTIIDNWKKLDPAEYHTPEGIDQLKQSVGQILEGLQPRTQSDMVIKGVYSSIKNEINKQAPTYAKTMKAYSESTDLIREIERSLSLGDKASADTAMRKLQSLTRNNVNTNYGQRLKLAQELEAQGGQQMMPALSGQALAEFTPRGIQRATAPIGGVGLFSVGGIPAVLGGAAVSSPRIVGEATYGAGRATRGLLDVNQRLPDLDYPQMFNLLYQAEQMKEPYRIDINGVGRTR
jgi:hypothetical protein